MGKIRQKPTLHAQNQKKDTEVKQKPLVEIWKSNWSSTTTSSSSAEKFIQVFVPSLKDRFPVDRHPRMLHSITNKVPSVPNPLPSMDYEEEEKEVERGGDGDSYFLNRGVTGLTQQVDNVTNKVPAANGIAGLTGLLTVLSNLSMPEIIEYVKNMEWEFLIDSAKNLSKQAGSRIQSTIMKYLEPYKEFVRENKILLMYITIAIGVLMIPIFLYFAFVFFVLAIGFVIFCVVAGVIVTIGLFVLIAVLIPIVVLILVVGAVIFVVNWAVKKIRGYYRSREIKSKDKPIHKSN